MIITFEEVLSRKKWLQAELLRSLTPELIHDARDKQQYDVKLLVNGHELEPDLYNDLVNNIEKYVDAEANRIINDRLDDVQKEIDELQEVFSEAVCKLRDKYNIPKED